MILFSFADAAGVALSAGPDSPVRKRLAVVSGGFAVEHFRMRRELCRDERMGRISEVTASRVRRNRVQLPVVVIAGTARAAASEQVRPSGATVPTPPYQAIGSR